MVNSCDEICAEPSDTLISPSQSSEITPQYVRTKNNEKNVKNYNIICCGNYDCLKGDNNLNNTAEEEGETRSSCLKKLKKMHVSLQIVAVLIGIIIAVSPFVIPKIVATFTASSTSVSAVATNTTAAHTTTESLAPPIGDMKKMVLLLFVLAVMGISIYYIMKFLKEKKCNKKTGNINIKDLYERNCMKFGSSGSGILIRTTRDFSKKERSVNAKNKEKKETHKKDYVLLLTNYHVLCSLYEDLYDHKNTLRSYVENEMSLEPISDLFEDDGKSFRKNGEKIELIYYDRNCDLALLRVNFYDISGNLSCRKSFELAKSNPNQLDRVCITGIPEGITTIKDQAAVLGIFYRAFDNFSIEKKQQDEGVSCLKIDTPVEDGFSGGPVINSEGKIVGIVVSGEKNNCLAISVQQIYKFLETAEAVYKKKRNLGKHGLKMKISETETDGQTTLSQFFEITDYDESNDVFNSQFKESLHHAF